MSPQAVLSGDAMRLATVLCPEAKSVRVRIDCSTPHDVLAPLCNLKALKELSVVCVTSGERCLLDFTDIAPVLEAHGESSLASLELKVVIVYCIITLIKFICRGRCVGVGVCKLHA